MWITLTWYDEKKDPPMPARKLQLNIEHIVVYYSEPCGEYTAIDCLNGETYEVIETPSQLSEMITKIMD